MKSNTKPKNSGPFTGKPAIGLSLANAVGNIYNLEEEFKELEKPTIPSKKPVAKEKNDIKKAPVTKSPTKTQAKVSSSKKTDKIVEKPNPKNPMKMEEEVKRAPEIDIEFVKPMKAPKKFDDLYKIDKTLEKSNSLTLLLYVLNLIQPSTPLLFP